MGIYRPRGLRGDVMGIDITPMTKVQRAQYARDKIEEEWKKLRKDKTEIKKISQKFKDKVAADLRRANHASAR